MSGNTFGSWMQQTITDLAHKREVDVRAALVAWRRLDLLEHGFIIDLNETAFGLMIERDEDGRAIMTVDNRILIGDERLCGRTPPVDATAFVHQVTTGEAPELDYDRVALIHQGETFKVALWHPEENRKHPPIPADALIRYIGERLDEAQE